MDKHKNHQPSSLVDGEQDDKAGNVLMDKEGSQTLYKDILDLMDIAMWEFDLEYRIVNYNMKAQQIYGDEILGQFCYYAAAKRDSVCEDCPAKLVYEGHDSGRSEHYRKKADGSKIYIDHIAAAIKDPQGTLTGIMVLVIDITKHKLLEEDLKKHRDSLEEMVFERAKALTDSEKKYRTVMTAAPDPFVVYDLNGNATFINQAFTRVFGWLPKEIIGGKIDFIPKENKSETKIAIKKALNGGYFNGFETQRYTKKGNLLDVSINAANYVDSNGQSRGLVVCLRDITEWKKTNRIMVQTEKMMSLGGLAAGMAHEINNPLSGILQNAQVAINRMTKDLPANRKAAEEIGIPMEKIVEYMEKRNVLGMLSSIQEAGSRAAKIVGDMLTFSRAKESKRAPNDITVLFEKALSLAEKNHDPKKGYDFKKIEVIREFKKNIPMVFCEETKIQQVLLNILQNGSYAMLDYGIEKPQFIVRCKQDNNRVRIEIQDNGPGMDNTISRRIFEPFYTTKAEGIGTGLGLSISYYIITENHGGTMEVDSTPGKGATFIISLPLGDKDRI